MFTGFFQTDGKPRFIPFFLMLYPVVVDILKGMWPEPGLHVPVDVGVVHPRIVILVDVRLSDLTEI